MDLRAAEHEASGSAHQEATNAVDGPEDVPLSRDAAELKEVKAAAVAAAIAADYLLAETRAEHVAAMRAKDEEMALAANTAAAELKAVQAQIQDLLVAFRKSQHRAAPASTVANEAIVESATTNSISSEKTDEQHHAAAVIQARLRQRSTNRDMRAIIQAHSARIRHVRQRAEAKLDFEVAALREEADQAQVERDETWQQALEDGVQTQREHLELEYASKVKAAVAKVTAAADAQVRAAKGVAARAADELLAEQSKNAKLVQQLDRAKQMEFQWRGIAWRALHQEPDNQSVEDQPQTQASHYHSHSSRASSSRASGRSCSSGRGSKGGHRLHR